MTLSAEQRRLRSRIGGFALRATHDPAVYTAAGRSVFLSRFLAAQPADLPEAERQRRAEAALKAYMSRLSLAASLKRSARP